MKREKKCCKASAVIETRHGFKRKEKGKKIIRLKQQKMKMFRKKRKEKRGSEVRWGYCVCYYYGNGFD